jgi:hypothetical protein
MNIVTVLIVLDILFAPFTLGGYPISFLYMLLAAYGILLPIRRTYTISRLVVGRDTEKKFASLVRTVREDETN